MRGLPNEVFEAARIDGAADMRIFATIVLPLCRPSLAALGALASTWIFNDLIWAMTVLRTADQVPHHRRPAQPAGRVRQLLERGGRRSADRRDPHRHRLLRLPEALRLRPAGRSQQVAAHPPNS